MWTLEPPLPAPRAKVAEVAADGNLHTIGGNLNNIAVTAHDAYDPEKNAWRTLANLPEPRDHVAVAQSGRKIFTVVEFKAFTDKPENAFLKQIPGVTTIGGGVPIKVGNELIGGVGVSGAPGGDKDDACANASLARVAASLQ
jgi:hypothetical protein